MACICCKNCSEDVGKASAPIKGLHVWGGFVISDEFDVNAVAFGIVTKPFACTKARKRKWIFHLNVSNGSHSHLPELLKPRLIGRLAALAVFPFAPVIDDVRESLGIETLCEMASDPVGVAPEPLIVDNIAACIWCTFFCSFSLCVSANFTTRGAEHPSIVWVWFSPWFYPKNEVCPFISHTHIFEC